MNEETVLDGSIESVIYKSEDNGYTVFSVLDGDTETVCVGNAVDLRVGENVRLTGAFVMHAFYGTQFSVRSIERVMPNTTQGIERYLGSGIIRGIGAVLAKRIVERFGEDTFDIIEGSPVRLAEVKGISKKTAFLAAESYLKQLELKNVMLYLQELGIGTQSAIKIYARYKTETFDVIKTNPYKIADDIFGIGFKTADAIAEKIGIEKNSIYRIRSGIKYALNAWAQNGHTYMCRETLYDMCAELLELEDLPVQSALTDLQIDGQVVQKRVNGDDAVYLSYYYNAESNCAKKIAGLSREAHVYYDDKTADAYEREIGRFEAENGIVLADKQKEAIKEALSQGVLVITGGPGTGKTTIINALINILKKGGKKVLLTAPTGRAAKRMTEASGMEAQTIHRLLMAGGAGDGSSPLQKFAKGEDDPLVCDVIIVDETSMVDILLLNSLLKAVLPGTRIIMAGDANQLPSVGAGNVLADIIKSGCVKVVSLDAVFRQAQKSAIIMNAHKINKGEYPVFNEKDTDFFFLGTQNAMSAANKIVELLTKRLPNYIGLSNASDIQVLTPMRKSMLGVSELNKLLQQSINPPSPAKREKELRSVIFREGDKVMQIKNNYDISWIVKDENGFLTDEGTGVFNGDQGFITNVSDTNESITVRFDDGKIANYTWNMLEELELAYAITIHKSQGSEYPAVVIPILTGPYLLMTRNLLYTAVTRARRLVVLVGSKEKIMEMIDNNVEVKRYSAFCEQLVTSFARLL